MGNNRSYLVSFGDSPRYRVNFDGTRDEFLRSDTLRKIEESVADYLKDKFPAGGYKSVVAIDIADDDGRDYPTLDASSLEELLKSVKRQVQVKLETGELNLNAPFDNI